MHDDAAISDWHGLCIVKVRKRVWGAVTMFRLDYLSCFLTVVATILVGRKNWTGLLLSGVNSAIVCVIGVHTSQYGFIPANVFCICVYAFNIRKWRNIYKGASLAEPSCESAPMQEPLVTTSHSRRFQPPYAGARVVSTVRQLPLVSKPALLQDSMQDHSAEATRKGARCLTTSF